MAKPFSQQLEDWLTSPGPKTLADVSSVFAEKSFAIIIMVLMFLPALPIPTAGITHIFEIIVMLLSGELMIGRRTVWLPKRLQKHQLRRSAQRRAIPLMIKRIRGLERFSRRRLGDMMAHPYSLRLAGALFFICALAAFVAPPLAGLDTLPALAAVLIALSIILEDVVLFLLGLVVGTVGVSIVIALGGLTLHFVEKFWHLR